MAKIIFARIFLFALLLFSHGIRFTEEVRVFKKEKDEYYSGNHETNSMMRISSRNKINLNRGIYGEDHDSLTASEKFMTSLEYDTNDGHPTSPGHSPGVGHSTLPASSNDRH
ncbi:hypothetical protein CRYUN_Cryun35bG0028600 [Craigia yunnanensis]